MKQAPYRTFVIAAVVPAGSAPALYWDTGEPYHYVRLQTEDSYDILIVGGEDHKTGQANDGEERFARLEQWTRERFPQMGEVEYRWSGQVMEPVDGLAFIGRNPLDDNNVYIATGDSGQGMTHGTIAGILLTDLIQGRENKWADLYSPSRIRLKALPEYASENINVAGQYADYITAGDIKSESEFKPGGSDHARRHFEDRRVSRRSRRSTQTFSHMPAPWLHRGVELNGANLGLSVSRFAVQCERACLSGTG